MNLLMIIAQAAGFLALSVACLKVLENGPVVGPAFSPAARLVLLLLVFLGLFAAIEALSWRTSPRPGATIMIAVWGAFSIWRVFAPSWATFFSRPGIIRDARLDLTRR